MIAIGAASAQLDIDMNVGPERALPMYGHSAHLRGVATAFRRGPNSQAEGWGPGSRRNRALPDRPATITPRSRFRTLPTRAGGSSASHSRGFGGQAGNGLGCEGSQQPRYRFDEAMWPNSARGPGRIPMQGIAPALAGKRARACDWKQRCPTYYGEDKAGRGRGAALDETRRAIS